MRELRRLLMEHWDPIGVRSLPAAANEYDAYLNQIRRLVSDHASAERIAEHLSRVEHERMGLPTDAERLVPIGRRIIEWYDASPHADADGSPSGDR